MRGVVVVHTVGAEEEIKPPYPFCPSPGARDSLGTRLGENKQMLFFALYKIAPNTIRFRFIGDKEIILSGARFINLSGRRPEYRVEIARGPL